MRNGKFRWIRTVLARLGVVASPKLAAGHSPPTHQPSLAATDREHPLLKQPATAPSLVGRGQTGVATGGLVGRDARAPGKSSSHDIIFPLMGGVGEPLGCCAR